MSYDQYVADKSGDNLTTEDRRRTRYSNDFVRREVEKRQWWMNLFRVAGVVATLATALESAIQNWPK